MPKTSTTILWVIALNTVLITLSAQAAIYTVGTNGTYDYTAIDAAFDAAVDSGGTNIVRIMDSAAYSELVSGTAYDGSTADHITIEPDSGQTPSVYALALRNNATTVIRDMIIDGNLAASATVLLYVRYNAGLVVSNCTFRGKGTDQTSHLYGNVGTDYAFIDNTFDTNTYNALYFYTTSAHSDALVKGNEFHGTGNAVNWDRNTQEPLELKNNLFVGQSAAFYQRDGTVLTNVVIENNTFVRCGTGAAHVSGGVLARDMTGGDFGIRVKDNLFVGDGASSNLYYGINSYDTASLSDIDADYNGFWNGLESAGIMQVLYRGGWESVPTLNSYASAANNVVGDSDPFENVEEGDYHLKRTSWAWTAASDGRYIGALGSAAPEPFLFILR